MEKWTFSTGHIACVKVVGSVTRPFNTGDTEADLIIDYKEFKVTAILDMTSVPATDKNQFAEQTVDYNTFKEAAGAVSGVTASAMAIIAAGLSLAF